MPTLLQHRFTRARAFLLLAALLLAQWVLVQHEAEFEPHAAGHTCEWCLTHAPLAAGALSAAQPVLPAGGAHVRPVAILPASPGAPALAYFSHPPPVFLPA